jgi:hypothetical protein
VQVDVFPKIGFGAVKAKTLHALPSPLKFFIRNAAPALLAYRQFFAFKENVKLDVFAFALAFPRVLATFQPCEPSVLLSIDIVSQNCF